MCVERVPPAAIAPEFRPPPSGRGTGHRHTAVGPHGRNSAALGGVTVRRQEFFGRSRVFVKPLLLCGRDKHCGAGQRRARAGSGQVTSCHESTVRPDKVKI